MFNAENRLQELIGIVNEFNQNIPIEERSKMTFKEWRDSIDLSQKEVAIFLGCSDAMISQWEKCRRKMSRKYKRLFKEKFGFIPVDHI